MIVAGLGFTSNATTAHLEAALEAAALACGVAYTDISRLATLDRKAGACQELAELLDIAIDAPSTADLAPFASRCVTRSEASLREIGVPSLAEAAALYAAERATGETARLLAPRVSTGAATCALATTSPETHP